MIDVEKNIWSLKSYSFNFFWYISFRSFILNCQTINYLEKFWMAQQVVGYEITRFLNESGYEVIGTDHPEKIPKKDL